MPTPSGSVSITASSTNIANATADGTVGGVVAVGATNSTATVGGQASAYLDDDSTASSVPDVNAGGLNVQAGSADLAVAASKAAGGGLVAVNGKGDNQSTAIIQPPTNGYSARAYIGKNRNVFVTGNVNVQANDSPEADAQTHGVTGGGVSVGGSLSSSTINPVVSSYIDTGSMIEAKGSVSVSASAAPDNQTAPPSENIVSVDTGTSTVQVNNHGYQTGDVVAYNKGSFNPVVGLVSNRDYGVIAVDQDHLQLGEQFKGTLINADTITFPSPHNFVDGDAVRYIPDPSNPNFEQSWTEPRDDLLHPDHRPVQHQVDHRPERGALSTRSKLDIGLGRATLWNRDRSRFVRL